jgi:hypothetical protein
MKKSEAGLFSIPFIIIWLISSFFTLPCQLTMAQNTELQNLPTRYGVALTGGNTYDPENNITFVLLSGFVLFDYERVWRHKAPDPLRFKVEFNAGVTTRPDTRAIISSGIFALYYMKGFSTENLKPYVEGGIGVIYTDFQLQDQGLRFNFNPQMGIGAEFTTASNITFLSSLRLHHISNGGLHHDNRGINSVVLMVGRYF